MGYGDKRTGAMRHGVGHKREGHMAGGSYRAGEARKKTEGHMAREGVEGHGSKVAGGLQRQ